jgi:putative transposase
MPDQPPGFTALDPTKPITRYFRHLPHWRQDGATYFVTYRLNDALPTSVKESLEIERAWLKEHPEAEEAEQRLRQVLVLLNKVLDQGYGACHMRTVAHREILSEVFEHSDRDRYDLFTHVIMPNHVHLVCRPLGDWSLQSAVQSWKGISARRMNQHMGKAGSLWQDESYDRIVRDSEHLKKVVRYIHRNHVECLEYSTFYIRPEWGDWFKKIV